MTHRLRSWFESVWQDVRYAIRNLRRQPMFTLVALSILTAGIGLNSALFSVFKDAIAQPWGGIAEPSRAIRLYALDPDVGGPVGLSHPEDRFLADHATSVTGLVAWRNEEDARGASQAVAVLSAELWRRGPWPALMGAQPACGCPSAR